MSYLDQITIGSTTYDIQDSNAIANPSTKSNGQVLTYDSSSDKWIAANASGGSSVTVDTALSSTSTNPVQNKVITNKIGTGALPNSSSNLISAINYVESEIPTTASDIGAAEASNLKTKFFTTCADIGVSTSDNLITDVLGYMPDHSVLMVASNQFLASERPNGIGGVFILYRRTDATQSVHYIETASGANDEYFMIVESGTISSSWRKILSNPGTLPSLTLSVSSETLSFSWSSGTLPS